MKTNSKIISVMIGLTLASTCAPAALAARRAVEPEDTGETSVAVSEADSTKFDAIVEKAEQEIARRIEALNKLRERIQAMAIISDEQRTALKVNIQDEIANLNNIRAEVVNNSDLAALREDARSITESYKNFSFVVPQGAITATADRALALVDSMTTLGNKLRSRIAAAQTAGHDVASLTASLADYDAGVSDAKNQAQAAIDEVSALSSDAGTLKDNLATMKAARTKIQAAQQDLVAARKDAKDIVQTLRALDAASGSATSTD